MFSLSRLVVRRLLSQPSAQVIGTCVLPMGVGAALSGGFWKGKERSESEEGNLQGSSRPYPPTGTGSRGSPGQGLHQPHLALEPLPIFTSSRLGLRGRHFLYRHHFLRGWRMSEQSPEPPSSWQRPSACPSHLFHPAIKPEVKYLLNDAIRPVAHYGIYLAVNYGL